MASSDGDEISQGSTRRRSSGIASNRLRLEVTDTSISDLAQYNRELSDEVLGQYQELHASVDNMHRLIETYQYQAKKTANSRKEYRPRFGATRVLAKLCVEGQFDLEALERSHGRDYTWAFVVGPIPIDEGREISTAKLHEKVHAMALGNFPGVAAALLSLKITTQTHVDRMGQFVTHRKRGASQQKPWLKIASSQTNNSEGAIGLFAARQFSAGDVIGFWIGHRVSKLSQSPKEALHPSEYNLTYQDSQVPSGEKDQYLRSVTCRDHSGNVVRLYAKAREEWSNPSAIQSLPLLGMGMHYIQDVNEIPYSTNSERKQANVVLLTNGMVRATKRIELDGELLMDYRDPPIDISCFKTWLSSGGSLLWNYSGGNKRACSTAFGDSHAGSVTTSGITPQAGNLSKNTIGPFPFPSAGSATGSQTRSIPSQQSNQGTHQPTTLPPGTGGTTAAQTGPTFSVPSASFASSNGGASQQPPLGNASSVYLHRQTPTTFLQQSNQGTLQPITLLRGTRGTTASQTGAMFSTPSFSFTSLNGSSSQPFSTSNSWSFSSAKSAQGFSSQVSQNVFRGKQEGSISGLAASSTLASTQSPAERSQQLSTPFTENVFRNNPGGATNAPAVSQTLTQSTSFSLDESKYEQAKRLGDVAYVDSNLRQLVTEAEREDWLTGYLDYLNCTTKVGWRTQPATFGQYGQILRAVVRFDGELNVRQMLESYPTYDAKWNYLVGRSADIIRQQNFAAV